jgi:FKBP-type peptidyl-prolyl cis-trans isomerase SlyD
VIKKNKVISMSYCLKDTQGEELDRADADKPLDYLHGGGNIVPGLENALEGLKVGDKKEVTVKP